MAFSKIRLGVEEIFTIIISDIDGRRVGKWTVLKKDFGKVIKILINKYSLNFKVVSEKRDRDLDWAMQ